MEGLIGVVFGFLLALIPPWLSSRRRVKTHFAALKGEIVICRSLACTYLEEKIQAPLYRLPLDAYSASLPALLADGALSESEVTGLTKFYSLATEFNRGLDNVDHFYKAELDALRKGEYDRNRLKATRLYDDKDDNEYTIAIEIINKRL